MITWGKQGPAGCGLDRANWTYAALATSLYQTAGIAVSERTMPSCCTTHGVRPYRPTYYDCVVLVINRMPGHNCSLQPVVSVP